MPQATAPTLDSAQVTVRARGLSKRFGELQALDSLDMEVGQGEVFGFLGPNGSGKSTTIRLLLGFLRPSSGSAELLGMSVARDRVAILRRTGYLPSHAAFDEVTTGERALDDLAALGSGGCSRRGEMCERIHLDSNTLRRKVRDYSKGTRQKLAIVQACAFRSKRSLVSVESDQPVRSFRSP